MMSKIFHNRVILVLVMVAAPSVLLAGDDVSAVLILKPATASTDKLQCQGGADPKVVVLYNLKIGGKSDIRLGGGSVGDQISHDALSKMRTAKLKDLSKLQWRGAVLYATSVADQPMVCLPDAKLNRHGSAPIATLYSNAQLEGEIREGKTKQKPTVPLSSVWKIYLYPSGPNQDDALFRHAQEENNFGQWSFYLKTVSSYKVDEAQKGLAQASGACVDSALEQFRNGSYSAIDAAEKLAQKMVELSGNSADANSHLADVKREKQKVADTISRGTELAKSEKYDDALTTWEPMRKYLNDTAAREFRDVYQKSLKSSHDEHITRAQKLVGEKALGAPGLQLALQEYRIALARLPDSTEAQKGKREMEIQIALGESKRLREQHDAAKAREVLLVPYREYKDDARLIEELKGASCELSAQLYDKAKPLVAPTAAPAKPSSSTRPASAPTKGRPPVPVPVRKPVAQVPVGVRAIASAADKKSFKDARQNLLQAVELCPTPEAQDLLSKVNNALADYHIGLAQKELSKKQPAIALLNITAAQQFAHERADIQPLMDQAREQVQQRTHVQAGVFIRNASQQSVCNELVQPLTSEIESAITGAGGTNVQLLARDQAAQMLHSLRTVGVKADQGNYAIISGDIKTCAVRINNQPRQVQSRYPVPNATYQQLDEQLKDAESNLEACKKANPQTEVTTCASQRNNRNAIKDRRNRENSTTWVPYSYQETTFTASGQLGIGLQIDDSFTRGTRQAGEAGGILNVSCVDRKGVNQDDSSARDQDCQRIDEREGLSQMVEQAKSQLQTYSANALRSVAQGLVDRAQKATDPDLKLEYYTTYVFLTSEKRGPAYDEAMRNIKSRDEDLNPENALR